MVCPRCIKAVKDGLENMGYTVKEITLGTALVKGEMDRQKILMMLLDNGFELLDDRDQQLVNKIKSSIIHLVQNQLSISNQNLSDYLSQQLNVEYHTISHLFSSVEGITLEKYYILQRIEKVKELLVYNELSLKEIAFQLGFSSVAHLSAQFKKITGFTTSHFKEIGVSKRKSIDHLF